MELESSHVPHGDSMSLFDRDITPLPHKDGSYRIHFNPRWANGNGNPLGGLYIPMLMNAAVQEMKKKGWDYDVPVTNYLQYARSASLSATCRIVVEPLKVGKTMIFLLATLYEIDGSKLILCTTAHLVYASTKQMPAGYVQARTISHLRPSAPPVVPSSKDCVDFFDAFGLGTGRKADRGFVFLCDRRRAAEVRQRATALRGRMFEAAITGSEVQEQMDMTLECLVGFVDPGHEQPRPHDWLSVGLMTDCLWAINELFGMEADPAYRFWSTTVSLGIHFFPPLPEPSRESEKGLLLARATITHVAGGLSELEAVIWDSEGKRMVASARQTCLTKRELRNPPKL
ncbi:thioesterase-like superfamily-domain-containing protein [Hyaloraphidium curvatum]|nr:thioesterase-like superfamily-domain-containing protein [Hyaloraphidium curvatum]